MSERMKVCFVNVAFTSWYPRGQARLRAQCEASGIDFVGFGGWEPGFEAERMHYELGAYSFKPRAVKMARERTRADIVVWADCSVSIAKPEELPEFFERIKEAGVWAQYGGHLLGSWCNDAALKTMGLTRAEAMQIHMPIAGLVGFSMRHEMAGRILDEWQRHAEEMGTFKGSHEDHRHDQSALSYLMHREGCALHDASCPLVKYGKDSGATFDLYPVE